MTTLQKAIITAAVTIVPLAISNRDMVRIIRLYSRASLALFLLFPLNGMAVDGTAKSSLAGNWLGTLHQGALNFRLALQITETNAGFVGNFVSLDQNSPKIPFSRIAVEKTRVVLEINALDTKFTGELADNGSKISGKWNLSGQSFSVVFNRVEKPVTLNRPQEPKRPYPYREESVSCTNIKAGSSISGTLTLPNQGGHFPAVVLIGGSGAHDRNESLMGHQPFLVIADHLTRQGIAVLRVDDRGVGESTGDKMTCTDDDLTDDVLSEVAWLRHHPEIDAKQVGLIGHSEGGLIAPSAAVRDPAIAFIVLLAGPGVPVYEGLQTQTDDVERAIGMKDEFIVRMHQFQAKTFDIIIHQPDDKLAEKALRKLAADATPEERKQLGLTNEAAMTNQYQMILSPWFRHILAYDPKIALEKTHCAVFALNGEKDLQVAAKANLAGIAAALKAAGNQNFKTIELAGLNHLFQTCKTGLPSEYGNIDETFSPVAMNLIGSWILHQANKN